MDIIRQGQIRGLVVYLVSKLVGGHAYVLGSFPRSGTNYFEKAWKQKTGKKIVVFRLSKYIEVLSKQEGLEIISTIREPLSSLVSRTMIYLHEDSQQPIEQTIDKSVIDYINIYKAIIDGSHHIIDISKFDHLDYIIDDITKKENKKIDKNKINEELDSMDRYSRTFIGHEEYQKILGWVTEYDLTECKDLYWKAYSLSKYKDL